MLLKLTNTNVLFRFGLLLILIAGNFFIRLGNAQVLERHKLVVAQVNAYTKNIGWPTELQQYDFYVITNRSEIEKEFINLSKRKLNGKEISVTSSTSFTIPKGADVVFVSPEFNEVIPSIFNQIKRTPILLISDGYTDQRFVMINIINQDNNLSFEINKANILNQGLSILPNMLLLGGTELDVAQLYRQSQDSLRMLESTISQLENRYDSLQQNIEATQKIIREQNTMISFQTKEISVKQETINEQSQSLDSIINQFDVSGKKLDSIARVISERESKLSDLQSEIHEQSNQIASSNRILRQQTDQIERQEFAIKRQESKLKETESVVDSQKSILLFVVLVLILIAVGVFLLYRAYEARKRDASKLKQQKEELSKLIDELNQTQTQLVQSEKMASLGVLTAGIAHEINNAINFVYSGIHIIETKLTEIKPIFSAFKKVGKKDITKISEEIAAKKEEIGFDEAQSLIEKMIKNVQIGAERTTEIVKGLRTFSRSEDEQKTKIDIHKDIEVALLLLHSQYKDVIKLETSFEENLPMVDGYQGQLGQAFLNIIGNAIDAVKARNIDPMIQIKTKFKEGSVKIMIRDNGTGMSKETQEKIFDPFFTTKGVGAGTGLGLSITYGIIEKHNGAIFVSSALGAGTEFVISLPLSEGN